VVDQKVAEGDYVTGDYAVVHNWEAGLDLFDRLEKNETLRKSEAFYQSFYAQANKEAIGDYLRVREQFKALLSPSDEEHKNADALQASIQENLMALTDIGKAYSQASTKADSTKLEAVWLEQYAKMSAVFAKWHQLSADARQRMENGIPALQKANAALSESILPAANEKWMNSIQLQLITGDTLTGKERTDLTDLAFSCPLIAGSAVYRARSVLSTWGNYTFDDTVICGLAEDKEEGGNKSYTSTSEAGAVKDQWHIYPNPTRGNSWLEGPGDVTLSQIDLYDRFGRLVVRQPGKAAKRFELVLPELLAAGMYFIVLQSTDGSRQTLKLIIQP
jgi:hypothetical protein